MREIQIPQIKSNNSSFATVIESCWFHGSATTFMVNQVDRIQGSKASSNSTFINMAQFGSQHVSDLLVDFDLIRITERKGKDYKTLL